MRIVAGFGVVALVGLMACGAEDGSGTPLSSSTSDLRAINPTLECTCDVKCGPNGEVRELLDVSTECKMMTIPGLAPFPTTTKEGDLSLAGACGPDVLVSDTEISNCKLTP